jgi:hypothetical protein
MSARGRIERASRAAWAGAALALFPRMAAACPACAAGAGHDSRVLWLVGGLLLLPFLVAAGVLLGARGLLKRADEDARTER